MIERFLYTALSQGLAAVVQNPTLLDDMFGDLFALSSTELTGIKTLFATSTPKVRQGYARQDAKMPLFCIVLQGEQQSDYTLSDCAGMTMVPMSDPTFGMSEFGTIWEHTFHILCYAEHPDVSSYMYELAKQAVITNLPYFLQNGVLDPMLGGMDLSPQIGYLPEHLFCRTLIFRCKRPFTQLDRSSATGRAFQIGGIAVAPASPSSNGGVKTLVTVGFPTDE